MTTRAKLVCQKVEDITSGNNKTGEQVGFRTQYNNDDSKEDNSYSIFTPNAGFEMTVTNPELFDRFKLGIAYYFYITEC